MRISYGTLTQMATDGDPNAQFVLAKWDLELGSQAARGKKLECEVGSNGEISLLVSFIHQNKQTLSDTPVAMAEQGKREAAITRKDIKCSAEPAQLLRSSSPVPPTPTEEVKVEVAGAGANVRRTPSRPAFRKETWQWIDKAALLAKARKTTSPELPKVEAPTVGKNLPFPSSYSFISED